MFLYRFDDRDEETTLRDDIFRFYGNSGHPTFSSRESASAKQDSEPGSSQHSSTSLDGKQSRLSRLRACGWWKPLMRFLKFSLQFIVTNAILYGAAYIFARIEDPVLHVDSHDAKQPFNITADNLTTESYSDGNKTVFFLYMKQRFNVSINGSDHEEFVRSVVLYKEALEQHEDELVYDDQLHDRTFIISKWFYFVTIATTTIGYGDVAPKTANGRVFYILFSIIGIPLMMSLLTSCGDIIKNLFSLINKRHLCKKRKLVSEELLAAISIFFLFVVYLSVGCVFVAGVEKWSFVDSFYYWIVTFTTVGFGDVIQPIQTQVTYIVPLVIYRTFGLALLAGCIDSILAWVKIRSVVLEAEALKLTTKKINQTNKIDA